ncbi:MAG: MoxR family ATPase [Armatimonadetes bacterium]|nr:MoxR family ATPase [Armatimonadota bacterium]
MDIAEIGAKADLVIGQVEKVIIGKHEAVKLALTALLSGGHLLIEDIPGVGKTMLARALARSLGCSFKRIQFTPDLLPADVTGTAIYNQKNLEFEFRPGPVFAHIVLADEINRATPKTQSALLESMEEFQVTVDGITHALPRPFFVIATQNNIEYHGTYALPEAQLDRFLVRMTVGYPDRAHETEILERQMKRHPIQDVQPVISGDQILEVQQAVRDVFVHPDIRDYIVDIVSATRRHEMVLLGASPRGSLNLMRTAQAMASISGRSYVLPDDVKALVAPVLGHRILLRPETRTRGTGINDILDEVVRSVAAPIARKA